MPSHPARTLYAHVRAAVPLSGGHPPSRPGGCGLRDCRDACVCHSRLGLYRGALITPTASSLFPESFAGHDFGCPRSVLHGCIAQLVSCFSCSPHGRIHRSTTDPPSPAWLLSPTRYENGFSHAHSLFPYGPRERKWTSSEWNVRDMGDVMGGLVGGFLFLASFGFELWSLSAKLWSSFNNTLLHFNYNLTFTYSS